MLARRLTTILPAMTLAEALETTRIHRVAGLTGDRTAVVTTRPRPTMACASWMNGPSAAALSWRPGANRLKGISPEYNFAGVADLGTLVALAMRGQASSACLASSRMLSEALVQRYRSIGCWSPWCLLRMGCSSHALCIGSQPG